MCIKQEPQRYQQLPKDQMNGLMNKIGSVICDAVAIGVAASKPIPRYPEKKHASGFIQTTSRRFFPLFTTK